MWVILSTSYRGLYILSTILTRKFCNYLLKVLITNVHGCWLKWLLINILRNAGLLRIQYSNKGSALVCWVPTRPSQLISFPFVCLDCFSGQEALHAFTQLAYLLSLSHSHIVLLCHKIIYLPSINCSWSGPQTWTYSECAKTNKITCGDDSVTQEIEIRKVSLGETAECRFWEFKLQRGI